MTDVSGISIQIKEIQNGFLVTFYQPRSLSTKSDYTTYCDSWLTVDAAIKDWREKFDTPTEVEN